MSLTHKMEQKKNASLIIMQGYIKEGYCPRCKHLFWRGSNNGEKSNRKVLQLEYTPDSKQQLHNPQRK